MVIPRPSANKFRGHIRSAVTYTLPAAVAGLTKCVIISNNGSTATRAFSRSKLQLRGNTPIFTDGTLSASGGYVSSGGAAADNTCVQGVDTKLTGSFSLDRAHGRNTRDPRTFSVAVPVFATDIYIAQSLAGGNTGAVAERARWKKLARHWRFGRREHDSSLRGNLAARDRACKRDDELEHHDQIRAG